MAIESQEQHKSIGLKMEARASNVKNGNRFRFSGSTRKADTLLDLCHIQELVQTLVEQDVVGQPDAWGAPGASPCLPAIQLPSTVQEVLAARLDRLPPAEKALLQTLAVIGDAVPWCLLAQVVGQPEEALYQPLGALQAAEFLYKQPVGSERASRFKHVLTQEMTYASLAPERRRRVHERTAQALEALHAERLEEHYGALAHHYRRRPALHHRGGAPHDPAAYPGARAARAGLAAAPGRGGAHDKGGDVPGL